MANYLDQIPKQLAARRKAFAAARDNPALLPSCWAIVRSIANNMYEYAKNSVIGGCTFPDRPVFIPVDTASFINFGASPRLMILDAAWREAEAAKRPPPDPDDPALSPEGMAAVRRDLAALARTFALNFHSTRVYNLETWLQEMYRDRLDVDFAEDLERQIDALTAYMDGVPKALQSTGLSPKLQKGVMNAFNLFKTITGSSHQLDREKMSFVDRRSYVNTIQKIETIMVKADESLGAAAAGRSVVRELFALWKDANYEMMALTRQLRALWAGTSLDDRIAELIGLLAAMQQALNRCSEESAAPVPQLPVFLFGEEREAIPDHAAFAQTFHDVCFHDMVMGANGALVTREVRRYGPLVVVIVPGTGQPRYCREIRRSGGEDEEKRSVDTRMRSRTQESENSVDRRARYPLNCLVTPVCSNPGTLLRDMADAWLEFNQTAFPVQFKEFLEGAKAAVPAAFVPPPDQDAKNLPPSQARRSLAGLVAAFARWARSGVEPAAEEAPDFARFREFALSRLNPDGFLVPLRYRPFLDLFAEAGAKRRLQMWKRNLGPRFALDRELAVVNVLRKDWTAFRESLKYLPTSLTRNSSALDNGFAKLEERGDPFAEHKALVFFQKFLSDQPDLKAALKAVESRVAIEVETLRTQSESLGKVFQYDQAAESMLQRQASLIQEKRLAANAHIDHYLTGLMYALDGNCEAAEGALSMCLIPPARRQTDDIPSPPVADEIGEEWFDTVLMPRDGKFEKRRVPGENGPGTVCFDFIYYNMGILYKKMHRHAEAMISFCGVIEHASSESFHLMCEWATTHYDNAKRMLEEESRPKAEAKGAQHG